MDILVPSLGESVTSATVARWLKQAGEPVRADEPVVELETDKVTVEVNAPAAGTLGTRRAAEGAEVVAGGILGSVEAAGAAASPTPAPSPEAPPAPVQAAPSKAAADTQPASAAAMDTYDVIVIGGGPGGYVAAIRAAQLGLRTACVEKRATLGGTCLNIGCIPSKALLQSSENFEEVLHGFKDHGVLVEGVKLDLAERRIVTSTGALELDMVPKHLAVIGGGYIGLELGSVWHRLGAEVTVIEYLDRLVPGMDGEIGKAFERVLGKQGIRFKLSTKVTAAITTQDGVDLTIEPAKGGASETLHADVVLVSIGRRPYTAQLGLADAGVAMDERGFVKTDPHYRTNVDGVYAIGDVISGPMLAHKAEEEGVAVAELIAGQAGHVNYGVIPGVVYTWPEVASIGATEEMLKRDGIAYNVGKFPFTANGRARAMGATDGFVKILADKGTDQILGAHIIGPDAGTLVAEIATAMEFGASSEDVGRICHAHPSLSEAVKEAALAVENRAIHI